MTREAKKLLKQALSLSERARAELAGELLDSLGDDESIDPAEIEAAWAKEIDRRVADRKAGRVKPIPWETAREKIQRDLRRLRRASSRRPARS